MPSTLLACVCNFQNEKRVPDKCLHDKGILKATTQSKPLKQEEAHFVRWVTVTLTRAWEKKRNYLLNLLLSQSTYFGHLNLNACTCVRACVRFTCLPCKYSGYKIVLGARSALVVTSSSVCNAPHFFPFWCILAPNRTNVQNMSPTTPVWVRLFMLAWNCITSN